MFKIRVRPHKENRYLYDITIFKRKRWFVFTFWTLQMIFEALPDVEVFQWIESFQKNEDVQSLDMVFNQHLKQINHV